MEARRGAGASIYVFTTLLFTFLALKYFGMVEFGLEGTKHPKPKPVWSWSTFEYSAP